MAREPRTVTIGGRRWRLLYERIREHDGLCDPPTTANKAIRIHRGLLRRPRRQLEIIIHECLHAAGWPLDETFIEQAAEDIGRILWAEGFRRGEAAP